MPSGKFTFYEQAPPTSWPLVPSSLSSIAFLPLMLVVSHGVRQGNGGCEMVAIASSNAALYK